MSATIIGIAGDSADMFYAAPTLVCEAPTIVYAAPTIVYESPTIVYAA